MQFYSKHNRVCLGKSKSLDVPGAAVHRRDEAGFVLSLTEVLISVVIVAIAFGTIINGYLAGAKRTEWTGCSLAATSLGVQILEQARSGVWDISNGNARNDVIQMPLTAKSYTSNSSTVTWTGYTNYIMDIPWKGTNYVMATNFVTIQDFQIVSGVHLQMIRVDTVWPFTAWGNFSLKYYTNSISTYMAPDNRAL